VIGLTAAALPIFEAAGVDPDVDVGVVAVDGPKGVGAFIAAAKGPRIWTREPTLRSPV
jgi:catalase